MTDQPTTLPTDRRTDRVIGKLDALQYPHLQSRYDAIHFKKHTVFLIRSGLCREGGEAGEKFAFRVLLQ